MTDQTYAQSIATDLFYMLQAAQEQGVPVDQGFRNQAMSTPQLILGYLFLNKKDLDQVTALPPQVKKLVRHTNALAIIETITPQGQKQTAGIHLIWTSAQPCSQIKSAQEMLQGIQPLGLKAFTEQLKTILKNQKERLENSQDEHKDNLEK